MRSLVLPGLVCLLALAACVHQQPDSDAKVTGVPASGAPVSAADPWVLLPVSDKSAQGSMSHRSRQSASVVIENKLRVLGVRSLETENPAASHRYAVSAVVDRWEGGRLADESFRRALEITVHDVANDAVVHRKRVEQRTGANVAESVALSRLVDRALKGLTVEPAAATSRIPLAADTAGRSVANAARSASAAGSLPMAASFGLRRGAMRGAATAPEGRASLASADDAAEAGDSEGIPARTPVLTPAPEPAVHTPARATALTPERNPELTAEQADAFDGRAIAFFYGPRPPAALLRQFDRVVLEPDNVQPGELPGITAAGARAYAYLSIGEVGPERAGFETLEPAAVLGRNTGWNSAVMDLSAESWISHVLNRSDELRAAGYDGLFLDTMDSFNLAAETKAARAEQAAALARLIVRLAQRHPDMKLIANRGFEVIDRIAPHLEAVAAESLYARWNNHDQRYQSVPAADREWLLARLGEVRERHGLDVIAIDYVPPAERARAREVASAIARHGIVPWVATPALDHLGVGALDVVPREVLMLFDSRSSGVQEDAEVHRLLATPLEYLGYVPAYHDIATDGLPAGTLGGRYAGVVMWNRGVKVVPGLQEWFLRHLDDGVPLALFGAQWLLPDSPLAERMGLRIDAPIDHESARVRKQDASIGFEKPLKPRQGPLARQAVSVSPRNRVHLSLQDDEGAVADLVVSGPWGGIAAQPGAVEFDLEDFAYWVVDPYAFLQRALGLPAVPMPDVTSEQGKRLWLAHIDGDALPSWAEMPGRRLGAEVIRTRILDRYPLPHTISIVEAEMTQFDEHADRRGRMFRTMKDMFALPNVEIATHTFSHPFRWKALAAHGKSGRFNLPVGDYRYDPEREIVGSAAFIDSKLAPPGKRTRVLLWSGDALPGENALAVADAAGLANMNGGFTTISRAEPALSLVTPMARTVGKYVQVYAPIMNENVYTNDWRGPFDGFRRVIETFEMTDRPRRLKPINIYYHFYAGTKAAGIRSLEEVYAWSTEQAIQPTTVSAYAARVNAFRQAGLARRLDGRWQLSSLGAIRSLRVVGEGHRLERGSSAEVQRAHALHDGLYLDTDGSDRVILGLGASRRLDMATGEGVGDE